METKANYVLIGAFTILITVFLLLFTLWASKFSSNRNWRQYEVVFSEPVTGLTEGGSVQYNGLAVGTVEDLSLDERDARKVIALLKLKANTPIRVDTRAKLSQQGITGVPFILLSGGKPGAAPLQAGPDRDIPVIPTEPSALQNITDAGNRLVARLDQLLSEQNIQHITATLENLEKTTDSIASQRQDIAQLIVSARKAADAMNGTLDNANHAINGIDKNLVQRLPAVLNKLDSTLAKLDAAAGNANGMLAENRPALRKLTHDDLAQVGPTLIELRALIRDLHDVADKLQGNPARYILGHDAPKEFDPQ